MNLMRTRNLLILKWKQMQSWRIGPRRHSQKARSQRPIVFPAKTQKAVRSHQRKILERSKDSSGKRRSTHHKKKQDVKLSKPSWHWKIDAERDEATHTREPQLCTLEQQWWPGRYINFCIARKNNRGIETQNFSDHQNIARQSAPYFEGQRVVNGGAWKDLPVLDNRWLESPIWKKIFFKRWVCGTFNEI